jgi:hypothetical protein
MKMNRAQVLLWVLIGLGVCGGAVAADGLPPSLRACMKETDSARRLACFDRESALLAGASVPVAHQVDPAPARSAAPAPAAPASAAPVATAAATAGAAAATTQSATDKFGYRGNMARADVDKKKEAEQGGEELTAKVTAVETLPNGGLLLTLDNGQMWQQKTADRGMRIKVGEQITIKHGVLNSFLLTSESGKGSMRVARVK